MNKPHAEKIRKLRESRGWTQEHLASICEIDARTIQRLEAGKNVSKETLLSVASAFELEVSELLDNNAAGTKLKTKDLPQADLLTRITSGRELLGIVDSAHLYQFDHDDLDQGEEVELIGGFLQEINDYGDIADDLGPRQRVETTVQLSGYIQELEEKGFWVFGLQVKRRYRFTLGEKSEAIPMRMAIVEVLRKTNPKILKLENGEFLATMVK